MTNPSLLQSQTQLGITLGYLIIVALLVLFALILCVYTLRNLILETRLPGRRIFGLNCDGCVGKFRKNGQPLFRCYIKKPIVKFLIRSGIISQCLNLQPSNDQ
jgi:hypothetical protein